MFLAVCLTIAAARNRQVVGAKMTRQTQQEGDSSLTSAQPWSISILQTSFCLPGVSSRTRDFHYSRLCRDCRLDVSSVLMPSNRKEVRTWFNQITTNAIVDTFFFYSQGEINLRKGIKPMMSIASVGHQSESLATVCHLCASCLSCVCVCVSGFYCIYSLGIRQIFYLPLRFFSSFVPVCCFPLPCYRRLGSTFWLIFWGLLSAALRSSGRLFVDSPPLPSFFPEFMPICWL